MSLLIKPQNDRVNDILHPLAITPEAAGWHYVSFLVYQLGRGQVLRGAADGQESAVVVLSGIGAAEINGQTVGQVGERLSVFEDKPPSALYLS
ncbi:MAG TPA: 5-deoxy-glucuronate isomerase, partial [Ktedonobacteraceae bacterium]